MKKALTILFLSLSAIIILDSLNTVHALMMFLLAGIVPGTNIAISGDRMLEIFTLLIGFTLSRITLNLIRLREQNTEQPKVLRRRARISSARA